MSVVKGYYRQTVPHTPIPYARNGYDTSVLNVRYKRSQSKTGVCIVLYADDILLMAPSVDVADQLSKSVDRELIKLDMVINAKHRVVYALAQGVTLPVALYLLHLE